MLLTGYEYGFARPGGTLVVFSFEPPDGDFRSRA